ncbi:CYTH domain-containing protein [Candidatus Woesearchaeota archaeon]|nr:CYTH domain-containing protein [Candidatus Woesearchaeota archaeon]
MNIEVETRSFITEEKYKELIDFFKKEGKFLKEDCQETYYFDTEEDLRIQKNNFFSKIWMKKGKLHDDYREELEIKFNKEDFEILEKLFLSLGFNVNIKWFRNRHEFIWQDISIMIDYTKGYGYIIELEKMTDEENKERISKFLKEKLEFLNIPLTPKEEFDKRFKNYKENWKELTKQ